MTDTAATYDVTNFGVPFTQYLMPNGEKRAVIFPAPEEVAVKANKIIKAGYKFECEMLSTEQVSLTIADPTEEIDVAIRICSNGPMAAETVNEMINSFYAEKFDAQI